MGKLTAGQRADLMARRGVPAEFCSVEPDARLLPAIERGKNVCISGAVGRGKTYLACQTLAAWMERRSYFAGTVANDKPRSRFTNSVALIRSITDTFGNRQSASDAVSEWQAYGLLVIDDFGKTPPTAWNLATLWDIADRRWADGKPTIITTQYTADDLTRRLASNGDLETAEAIVSRLCADARQVQLTGHDRRAS